LSEPTTYGGQAVLEGVMMRGAQSMAVALRSPDGLVVVQTELLNDGLITGPMARIPLVRGALRLWDSLRLGMKALTASAEVAAGDEVQLSKAATSLSMVVGLAAGVGLFVLLPALLADLVSPYLPAAWLRSVVEGAVRLLLVVGYVWVVGLIPDIRRVYAYHGAEHKAVNAHEAGAELTVDGVRPFSTAHQRCGTALLLTVAVLAIVVFAPLGRLPVLWRIVSRIALLPVLAGLSYEFIRFTARFSEVALVRALAAPNLALQRLTTREPDDSMIEVAISALKAVVDADGAAARAAGA
jgi:uncharacterized protein YqhQ